MNHLQKIYTSYQRPFRWITAVLALILLGPAQSFATHIVGGEISYRCLGNNNYEITVRVYRDCANGDPDADFDDPASIGVFDRSGILVRNLLVPFFAEDTVTTTQDACLVIPSNVCVHTTVYVDTVKLNRTPGGYRLVYQRCCRNVTLNNIVRPLETGATYDIWLTEEAMDICNSSPVYKEWPPIFICANEPLSFDHSATDQDGDSLIYSLCMPFQGATFAEPKPQPPNPPPFDEVMLVEPTYSLDNLLGFGEPLKVDPEDGLMTVTPALLGQFVVGVCVDEYDRATGTLLSQTRRDFQYNVIECLPFNVQVDVPDAVCDNFTVQFENLTNDVDDFAWTLEGLGTSISSTDENPVFTFPDTGTYTVELTVEPNSLCESSFTKDVFVQINSIAPDFSVEVFACADSAYLFLQDESVDSVSFITDWEWMIMPDNGTPFTIQGENPVVAVPINSEGSIQLNVESKNTCLAMVTGRYSAMGQDVTTLLRDSVSSCAGDSVFLNDLVNLDSRFNYTWTGPGITDASAVNPKVEASAGFTTYQLVLEAQNTTCVIDHMVVVEGVQSPDLSFDVLSNCGGTSYTFAYSGSGASGLEWTIGDVNNPLATGMGDRVSFTFPAEGIYPITLKGTGECTDSVTRQIEILPASLQTDFDYEYEACTSDSLSVRLLDLSDPGPDSIVGWTWTLEDGRMAEGQNPLINFGASDTLDLKLVITTIGGCTDSITKNITVTLIEDVIAAIQDTLPLCEGMATGLDQMNDPRYSYTWLPSSGVDNPSAPDPIFSEAGTYTVNVFIPGSPTCSETKQVEVVLPPAINLSLVAPLESCATSEAITANVSADVNFTWFVNGAEVSETSNVLIADLFGNNTYMVIATDAFGCADTAITTLNLEGVDVEIPEQVAVCEGETINVSVNNLDNQDVLTYLWSPANLIASGQSTANITVNGTIGIQEVFVQIGNQHGCVINDTVEVVVVDDDIQLGFEVDPFCNGAIANFNNTSQNAFGYLWDFGDPNNPGASSTEENPTYNYNMPGTYTATLTIQYDVSCTDTVSQTFEIKDTTRFNVDFGIELVECLPGEATFRFMSLSTSPDSNLTYKYEFSDGTIVNEPNFERTITEFGTQTVTFTATAEDGCEGSVRKDFDFPVVEVNLPDTLISCDESGITLNPGGRTEYTYQWAAADGISDLNAASPLVTPTVTTTYSVTITANGFAACVVIDEVVVVVPDMPLQMDQPNEVLTCGEDLTLTTNIPGAVSYQWLDQDGNLLSPTDELTINPFRDTTITLIATDQFGCTYLDTILVIDQGVDAEVEPGTNLDLCEGQIFELGVRNLDSQDTLSYLWISDSLMITSETTATPMLNVDRSGTFIVQGVISNQHGCSDTVDVTINSGDLKIDLPDTVLICQDGPIELAPDADPNLNYTWSPSDGLSATNVANPTFTGNMDMTYFVMVNDPSVGPTCQVMDTVTVIVGGEVSITKNDHIDTTCADIEFNLSVNASGPDGLVVDWFKGENFEAASLNGESVTVTVDPGANVYYAIANIPQGCADTVRFDFYGFDLDMMGLDTVLQGCIGTEFDLLPNAVHSYMYAWRPANLLVDANVPNPRTLPLEQDVNFIVTVALLDARCTLMDTLQVDIKDDIILNISADTAVCPQDTVPLSVDVEPGATVQWLDESDNVIGTGPSIRVPVAQADRQITALATDTAGCEQRSMVNITITILDTGIDDLENGGMVDACSGIPTPINPGGNNAYTYTWSPDADLDLTNPHNPVATVTMDQVYEVTITDPNTGCTVMSQVQVNVIEHISILDVSNDTMICLPEMITLTATTNGEPGTLEWFSDAAMTQSLGTGESIQVMPGEGENIYYVKTDDQICNDSRDRDTVKVEVVDFTAVAPEPMQEVCKGETVSLNANADDRYTYEWSPANVLDDPTSSNPSFVADSAIQFSVKITAPDGECMDTRTVDLQLDDPINIDAGNDTIACIGGTFKLRAESENGENIMWATDRDFNNIIGMGAEVEIMLNSEGQYYYVKGDNGGGCSEIDSVLVSSGEIDAEIENPVIACDANVGAELMVINNDGAQDLTYLWTPESKIASNPLMGPNATLNPGADGLITVALENQFGCTKELTTVVEIQNVGDAEINASDTSIAPGNPVQLMIDNCDDCDYQWEPANEVDNPNSGAVIVTPLVETTYTVTVGKGDCENVLSITISPTGELCSPDNIFIPRAFTPNGDNNNDLLFVRSNVIQELHFIVYNRWGQEVFDTRDINEGWDGTFRGSQLPPDVYGYRVDAICIDGSEITLQGNVTLFR